MQEIMEQLQNETQNRHITANQENNSNDETIQDIIKMFANNSDSFPLRHYLCACLDRCCTVGS